MINLALKLISKYERPYTRPPLDQRMMKIHKRDKKEDTTIVMLLNNDGAEVWIGSDNRWDTFLRREDFTKFCLWYLSTLIFVDWFGLRTYIYYKLLKYKA